MPKTPKSKNFQVKFNSEQIHPDTISLVDLTEVLQNFEKGLLSIVREGTDPLLGTGLGLSLVSVKPGCAAYELQPMNQASEQVLKPAMQEYYRAAKTRDRSSFSATVRKSIEKFEAFSLKYDCKSELRLSASNKHPNATIRPPRIIKLVKDAPLSGETTIYGRVEQVGGADTPTLWIRQADGVRVKVVIDQETAPTFGRRLYDWVGLRGHASWDEEDQAVEQFKLIEIIDYQHRPITEAFALLAEEIGDLFEELENADDFVTELRRE